MNADSFGPLLGHAVSLGLITNGPFALMAILILLRNQRPVRVGLAFLVGYAGALAIIVVTSAFVLQGHVEPAAPVDRSLSVLNVVLGLASVGIGIRLRRRVRPPIDVTAGPSILDRMAGVGLRGALVAGCLVPTYPPAVAAGITLARSQATGRDRLIALVVYVVVASVVVLVPVVAMAIEPGWTSERLDRVHLWVTDHRRGLLSWTLLAVGVLLILRETAVVAIG